jgi:hypothetical protein
LIPIQKVAGSSPVERAMVLRWGCSSAGRALRWQRRGRGFEPLQLHHIYEKTVEIFDFLFVFHTHITMNVYDNNVQGKNLTLSFFFLTPKSTPLYQPPLKMVVFCGLDR